MIVVMNVVWGTSRIQVGISMKTIVTNNYK